MAVEVIQGETTQEATQGGVFGGIVDIYDFFADNWVLMVTFVIILVLAIGAYFLWKKLADERKRRDDVVYLNYCNIDDSCRDNAKKEWIRKYWNPKSLFLLLLPVIGWILIPFVKSESSAKIRDRDNNFIGWYRGHSYTDDGMLSVKYYNSKSFIFFEDTKILLVPTRITEKIKNEKGVESTKIHKIKPAIFKPEELQISMTGVRKRGNYFWYPVLVTESGDPISLSDSTIENLQKSTGYEVIENLTSDFSMQMRKAVNIAADVRKDQETTEPTQDASHQQG
jgi:hypothetical protein